MRHIVFQENSSYPVAILIKNTGLREQQLRRSYLDPLAKLGVPEQEVVAIGAPYNEHGKAPVRFIRNELEKILLTLVDLGTKYLYVADAAYFKVLTRETKTEPHYGAVLPCKMEGYEQLHIVLGLNHQSLIFNPDNEYKIGMGLEALVAHATGTYSILGGDIIHTEYYPETYEEIRDALNELHKHPKLFLDIETFSLRFEEAGLGSFGASWDMHNGIAFACDYSPIPLTTTRGNHGEYVPNYEIRKLVKEFLETYQGIKVWHNANYDNKILTYVLWMSHPLDMVGMLEGIDILAANCEDTKIIAYVATNQTSDYPLGLKALAQPFAGNWAQDDINDIRKIPKKDLLSYNLIDCLSTAYLYEKYVPIMFDDKQEEIYRSLLLPSMKLILQMELVGMPMCDKAIAAAKLELVTIKDTNYQKLVSNPLIKSLEYNIQYEAMVKKNATLKKKQHHIEKFSNLKFNPRSGPQVQQLLYELMGLPVIDLTKTKQPSTGADTLEKLINHTDNVEYKSIIEALIEISKVNTVLSTFIPTFEKGILKADDVRYLHGNFNIGGTISGRLSSSGPNLQNIPSGSTYGNLIKSCFISPPNGLFVGADFSSLEDMISALTTKDPNKLKVYIDGYDGHCLRAFAYFRSLMPDIEETVDSINSIEDLFPEIRQDSKAPTFLLTYGGTYHGLMRTLGISEEEAKRIEKNFKTLYAKSIEYIREKIEEASRVGYVTTAFGLRLRTPLLKQVILNSDSVPYEAMSEARSAGNALGQGYGLLNNRAAIAFMNKVWESPYRYKIFPSALIHDAIYLIVEDDSEVLDWVNTHLIKEMQWQELPEIMHDEVKLGANLEVFWPNWSKPVKILNEMDAPTIQEICSKHKKDIVWNRK